MRIPAPTPKGGPVTAQLTIPNWTRIYTGKVHDMYQPAHTLAHSGGETAMLVASDRIAVLDRVLPSIIPGKGEILTRISTWWFRQLEDVVANHYLSDNVPHEVTGRAMIVQRLRMYPIECTVVGYMTDKAFEEYSRDGRIGGVDQPAGLALGEKLPAVLFVPALKGEVGRDDETISFERMGEIVGTEASERLREISLALYERAQKIAGQKGLVIAECKLEFGASSDYGDDEFVLADQAFTPDSATYWLDDEVGGSHPRSFGKDYVRYVVQDEAREWIRGAGSPPILPKKVVDEMASRYRFVQSVLMGE
ncbi:phosphoribosylaminoimidazolesuccinocarboxamide synthase [Trueperella pecoris]|nr:phosphoribosylaminoimidazolesuccinocarboxamide synthase [Trueperella pecoris]